MLANRLSFLQPQIVFPIGLFNRLHAFPIGHCLTTQRPWPPHHPSNPCLPRACRVVSCSRCQYPGGLRSREKPSRTRSLSPIRILYRDRLSMLYQLGVDAANRWSARHERCVLISTLQITMARSTGLFGHFFFKGGHACYRVHPIPIPNGYCQLSSEVISCGILFLDFQCIIIFSP